MLNALAQAVQFQLFFFITFRCFRKGSGMVTFSTGSMAMALAVVAAARGRGMPSSAQGWPPFDVLQAKAFVMIVFFFFAFTSFAASTVIALQSLNVTMCGSFVCTLSHQPTPMVKLVSWYHELP
jgi:hypothetical protein